MSTSHNASPYAASTNASPRRRASNTSSNPPQLMPVPKKRLRGRSLRSNVLLRPRPGALPPPQVPPIPDSDSDSDSSLESSDYSSDDSQYEVKKVPKKVQEFNELQSAEDTEYWGWVVLASTWIVTVVGMGSVIGVWDWAWGTEPKVSPLVATMEGQRLMMAQSWPRSVGGEKTFNSEFPIPGYYPAIIILTCVMAWVWVVVAWVGMKYFKHAKIQS